jgi:hypothetical protein
MSARMAIDHDARPGPLKRCQISGSGNLNLIIDLGHQPPCDALLSGEQLSHPEMTYPLRLWHCPESGLAQLDYVVDGREIYPPNYPYKAGISWPLREYQAAFARSLIGKFHLQPGDYVVDIGCNDGTLLANLKTYGCQVLGVEPTDVAQLATKENGVPVVQAFFTESLARDIARDGGAKLVTMTNVFAHMGPLGEVMRGLVQLLDRDGVFATESHYLMDVLEKHQFDTIYHEHVRTYSLKALCALFPQYGLEVFDVERGDRYGGNIRAYVARTGVYPVSTAVTALLALEDHIGLHDPSTWSAWRVRVQNIRDGFMQWLYTVHRAGASVVGCSAPGRASTLLNWYGVKPDLMPWTGELQDSLKIGKYLPACHIEVVDNRRIIAEQPDYVVLLAWHYSDAIVERLRREGVKSKLVLPLPQFKILDSSQ